MRKHQTQYYVLRTLLVLWAVLKKKTMFTKSAYRT